MKLKKTPSQENSLNNNALKEGDDSSMKKCISKKEIVERKLRLFGIKRYKILEVIKPGQVY